MTPATLLDVARPPLDPRSARAAAARARVRRPRLVTALAGPDGPPFAVLVAPAGFGKTTLLSEWSTRDPRPFAWITLDPRHNEPRALLRADLARHRRRRRRRAGRARRARARRRPRVALRRRPRHDRRDRAPSCRTRSRSRWRRAPSLPVRVARLRAQGLVTELRHGDLAMTRAEAAAAAAARRACSSAATTSTRCCAAPRAGRRALSLAALSLGDQPVPGPAVARFGGGDRLVAEYLRDEVLSDLSEDELRFVLRTSILDVLTAPVCDAVLERSGLGGDARRGCSAPTSRSWRSTAPASATATIACSATCCAPSCAAREPRARGRRCTGARAPGTRARATANADFSTRSPRDELGRAGDLVWGGVPSSIEQGSSAPVEHWLSRFTDAQVAAAPAAGAGGRRDAARPRPGRPRRALARRRRRRLARTRGRRRRRRACARRWAATGSTRMRDDAEQRVRAAGARQSLPGAVRAAARRRRAPARGLRAGPASGSRRPRAAPPCRHRTSTRSASPSSP